MKIVIATDSYKGTQSALGVARNIEIGIKRVVPGAYIKSLPIADGGEGIIEAMVHARGGNIKKAEVRGPLGKKIEAEYAILSNDIAVIEMSTASGLPLVSKKEKDPLKATSYGTGELIRKALDMGCKKMIIGVGGSATNDGGIGMAQALGFSFLDKDGAELGFGGGSLDRLHTIDTTRADKRLKECQITIASDVKNPLYGENGASKVFGPQKGATSEMVKILDNNLRHYANIIKKHMGKDIDNLPGGGAGGGIGAGLVVFCNGTVESGINVVLDAIQFENHIKDADIVITGEGKIDGQSIFGKVPVGVATRVKALKDIPVIAIVGDIGYEAEKVYEYGIDAIMSTVNRAMDLDEAMKNSAELLQDAGKRLMEIITIGTKIKKIDLLSNQAQ